MKKHLLFIAVSVFFMNGFAQVIIEKQTVRLLPEANKKQEYSARILIPETPPNTYLVFQFQQPAEFAPVLKFGWISAKNGEVHDTIGLHWEPHGNDPTSSTFPIRWNPQSKGVLLMASNASEIPIGALTFITMQIPEFGIARSSISSRASCDSPAVLLQSFWRDGLPPPTPGRSATPTHHCIVHHSAGGNGDTNYTDLVRAYYTFHTQINGWDDIGYNYLIAANGTIYAGRDPEKPGIRQDDVLGAHFCSKNSNTMGVCMIGDFTDVEPTAAAYASLHQLLGWKVAKDALGPYDSLRHPDNIGDFLGVIAGHRDGCATECPGDALYATLHNIRSEVAKCVVADVEQPAVKSTWKIISQENGFAIANIAEHSSIRLFDLTGRVLHAQFRRSGSTIFCETQYSGLIVICLQQPGEPTAFAKHLR